MTKTKNKAVKGFNMNKKTGHVSLAFRQKGNMVEAASFTHDKKEDYGKKTKLKYNINPKDERPCYVKNDIEKYKSKFYKTNPKYKDYRIHEADKEIIKTLRKKCLNKKDRQ